MFLRRGLAPVLALSLGSGLSAADFTATYPFTSVSTSSGLTDPTTLPVVANLTLGAFRAVGTPANPNAGGRFSFTDWATGAAASNDTYSAHTGAVNTGEYYAVTLTPQAGYALNLTSLSFTVQRSGTGIRTYAVRSDAGGNAYATNLPASISPANGNLSVQAGNVFYAALDSVTTAQNGSTVTLTGAAFQNLTSAVTFRFYGWNAEGSGGTFSIDNVVFTGSVEVAGSGSAEPAITGSTPSSGSTGVATDVAPTVTFNQAVTVTGAWFTLVGSSTGTVAATASGGPTTFTLTPASAWANNETVTLTVLAAQVTDAATGLLHPVSDYAASFTTVAAAGAPTPIHAIQGSGAASPLAGQTLTISGVVTGFYAGSTGAREGFYVQEEAADADADDATSEGIYVYAPAAAGFSATVNALALGDVVTVVGNVLEYNGLTELTVQSVSGAQIAKTGTAALPTAVAVTLPATGSTALERYENMRVSLPQTLTVTGNYSLGQYGEIYLSSAGINPQPTNVIDPNDAPASGLSSSGTSNVAAVTAQQTANGLASLVLDDSSGQTYVSPTPHLSAAGTRRLGDTVTGLTGVLTYRFSLYRLDPQGAVAWTDSNPRPAVPPVPGSGRLRVASANVLNYFLTLEGSGGRGATTSAEFARQKAKIVANLTALSADVVGLMEIERQSGNAPLADLVAGLNAELGAGTYAYIDSSAIAGTDAIQVALIYKPATVTPVGAAKTDAANLATYSRPPLAQTFTEVATGAKFTIVVNHFKSKGSSGASGADTDQGDGQSAYNARRKAQAAALVSFLSTPGATFGDPDVLVVGDLNAYAEEDPIDVLRAGGFTDQLQVYEPGGYSYQFDEQVGYLDHALANPALAAQLTGAAHWHINADEPAFYDYNLENKDSAQQAVNVGTPFRSSDHDPVIVGLDLTVPLTPVQTWRQTHFGTTAATGAAADAADPDGDGVSNLLEYALGTTPTSAASAAAPAAAFDGGTLAFRYTRPKSVTDLTYTVQKSSDLLTWTAVGTAVESSTSTTETLLASWTASATKEFVRLSVGSVATTPLGYLRTALTTGATTALAFPFDDPAAPSSGLRAAACDAVSTTTLTRNGAGWAAGVLAAPAAPWAVRVTSGAAAGKWWRLAANTATTLTVVGDSLTGRGVVAGDTFELVPLSTLGTLFGATLQGAATAAGADVVQVRSGSTWLAFYYNTTVGAWRRTIGPTAAADNTIIPLDSGVLITRRGAALTMTATGRVLGTDFRPAVALAGGTVLHAGYPMDTTLGALALQTLLPGWRSGTSASTADQVFFYNGTAWVGYLFDGSIWRPSTGSVTDSAGVGLPAGGLLLIQRPGTTAGTTEFTRPRPY